MRVMTGSSMSPGRSPRTRVTASRTSFTARSRSLPNWNSTEVDDTPSETVDMMCDTSPTVDTAFSITRVTCVSSSAGAAPTWLTLTVTTGMSTSGYWLMPSLWKPSSPAKVSSTNRMMGGMGALIARAEMFCIMTKHLQRWWWRRWPPGSSRHARARRP
jgi:hypothetical protein